MSSGERFILKYEEGNTPWELNEPDSNLMNVVTDHPVSPGRALEIGCGIGFDCMWLAGQGFEVTGTDISPLAIKQAEQNALQSGLKCSFIKADFVDLKVGQLLPGAPFDFMYDRGCFHVFEPEERDRFARNAAAHLGRDGLWLSIMGNSNDPPRKHGPPMLSAEDIARAVEPYFEIISIQTGHFSSEGDVPPRAWICLMRNRTK